MECPNCGDRNTTVKDSRKVEMNVFRTRYCSKCGNTFYTEEIGVCKPNVIEPLDIVYCKHNRED